jgi:hypothetical protein
MHECSQSVQPCIVYFGSPKMIAFLCYIFSSVVTCSCITWCNWRTSLICFIPNNTWSVRRWKSQEYCQFADRLCWLLNSLFFQSQWWIRAFYHDTCVSWHTFLAACVFVDNPSNFLCGVTAKLTRWKFTLGSHIIFYPHADTTLANSGVASMEGANGAVAPPERQRSLLQFAQIRFDFLRRWGRGRRG